MEKTENIAVKSGNKEILGNIEELKKLLDNLENYISMEKEKILSSKVVLPVEIKKILNLFKKTDEKVKFLALSMLNKRYSDVK